VSRVLVTGATGFIGRHALTPLADLGLDVHAVSSQERGGPPGVTWHRADLLAPGGPTRLIGDVAPELLLHLAWYAEPGRFWTAPENAAWVQASVELVRAFAAAGGRRAVLAGTCAEYRWGDDARCREGVTPLEPSTFYGRCKHATQLVTAGLAEQAGFELAWGRIFFLYGPDEDPRRLVSSVARSLVAGEPARTTSGRQLRDFLHVADVASAFAALVGAGGVTGPVNVASGEAVAIRDVVARLGRAAGRPDLVELGALPDREGEPATLVADARRLRDEVGWAPAHPLGDGLAATLAWWRDRA
jgi:nucleoside-diphosphate-sugar epimerase